MVVSCSRDLCRHVYCLLLHDFSIQSHLQQLVLLGSSLLGSCLIHWVACHFSGLRVVVVSVCQRYAVVGDVREDSRFQCACTSSSSKLRREPMASSPSSMAAFVYEFHSVSRSLSLRFP